MKRLWTLGVVCAVLLHAAIVLFGGILFPKAVETYSVPQEVELLSDDTDEEEPPRQLEEEEELQTEEEPPPDATEILKSLEEPVAADAPALDAASLGALEQALDGHGGGGDFAQALSLTSGGRIGGSGKAGSDDELESAFSLAEIDQRPRVVFQAAPLYPRELRGKRMEGVVTVVFVVSAAGKVVSPGVVKSTHPAFEKPALEAVRQWKFDPAIKGGQRVGCRMRCPIRFQPAAADA